jgi:dTDP-glucose 4,6-dehydratase
LFLPYADNKNLIYFKFYKLNINKNNDQNSIINLIKKNNIKFIINFSSQGMVHESWKFPVDWYRTNSLSVISLVEKIKKLKIKNFLQISTPEIYGNTNKLINEKANMQPSTPYAISRATADYHLMAIKREFKFPVSFARAANVYGPGQQLYRIIPKAMLCFKINKKITIHGMGKSIRSFIHISDAVDAYFKILLFSKPGSIYNIATNHFVSVKKLVFLIKKIMRLKSSKNLIDLTKKDRIGKDRIYKIDSHKIRSELQWKSRINLEDGLLDTLKWINQNFITLKKHKLEYKHKK